MARFKWSTGDTIREISINDKNILTYTVTVTDNCGNTATAKKSFEQIDGIKSVVINVNKSDTCSTNRVVRLNAIVNVEEDSLTYTWSGGNQSTNKSIIVQKVGTYSVTVTDLCNNTATASVTIGEDDLSPQTLKYAHVFFPDGTDYRFEGGSLQDTMAYKALSLNRTFGPINTAEYCIDDIQNYEFYIFNRWGQKVFESNNIKEEWDGMIKDQKAQGDTYVWVAKYTIFGFTKTVKGDVTMIRL